ncbi:MAG: hypothetical protein JKY81_08325 [Colwellia sp.]|nr:hypothetical protein [Colwellia sp.]
MNINFPFQIKYIIALVVGVIFTDLQVRLVGFSANMPLAFGEQQWARNHIELLLFLTNLVSHLMPLALITLVIGYTLAKLLKTNASAIIFISVLPSVLLGFPPLDLWTKLSFWYIDIVRLIIIVGGMWFTVKKFGIESDVKVGK